ncbi:hypothetical protein MASR1M50_28510 [Burkholderiales bacterium]
MTDLSKITCIEDLRVIAQRRVPRMFYDYADSGSWTEGTYRANQADFAPIQLRQRVAINMEGRSTATTMVGEPVAMPVALAPTGLTGMQHADGEIAAARAARAFGVPFTLSTMSICSIEDVAKHAGPGFWFQLYVMRDRDFIERLIDRAKMAGCGALVITLDLQILGQRHKDIKNGLSTPPKPTLANLINLATKPRWIMGMLGTPRRKFGNIHGHVKGVSDMSNLGAWTADQFDPRLNWGDVEWIKKRWGGKVILKGIMEPEDARLAVDSGADALIVSNHGGRQLDGAPSAIACPARHRRRRGQPDRGAHGQRHPQRPGRAQGLGPGRARHLHRPRLPVGPGRGRRSRRGQGAPDHPPRAGPEHGLLRPYADRHRRPRHPAAGHLSHRMTR